MPIGTQFPAFAACVLAAGIILDARDVAERQLAALVVTLQLHLDHRLGVIENEVIAACSAAQFPATQAGERLLLWQRPRRHVFLVVERPEYERMVDVPVRIDDGYFLADSRQPDLPEFATGRRGHHPNPR